MVEPPSIAKASIKRPSSSVAATANCSFVYSLLQHHQRKVFKTPETSTLVAHHLLLAFLCHVIQHNSSQNIQLQLVKCRKSFLLRRQKTFLLPEATSHRVVALDFFDERKVIQQAKTNRTKWKRLVERANKKKSRIRRTNSYSYNNNQSNSK